jgi:hypothetical protein
MGFYAYSLTIMINCLLVFSLSGQYGGEIIMCEVVIYLSPVRHD